MKDDTISRQLAVETIRKCAVKEVTPAYMLIDKAETMTELMMLPSAQPDIIRCKDCRWWDKYGDCDNGYCMAAKHGYWTEHWEISIRRTYKGDFYCADAERRTDG